MDKRFLKKLITASYSKDRLDEKKVSQIAKHLKRKELKQYIFALKAAELTKSVSVVTPSQLSQTEKKQFQDLYRQKRLEFAVDPSIITGVRIVEADIIFELSFLKTLEDVKSSISKHE